MHLVEDRKQTVETGKARNDIPKDSSLCEVSPPNVFKPLKIAPPAEDQMFNT
jgi:hypothetical protein